METETGRPRDRVRETEGLSDRKVETKKER